MVGAGPKLSAFFTLVGDTESALTPCQLCAINYQLSRDFGLALEIDLL